MVRRGPPCGNANALKHGKYTRERRALLAGIRAHIRQGHELSAAVIRALETGSAASVRRLKGRGADRSP